MSFYSGSARIIMVHFCIWDLLIVSVALGNDNFNIILYYSNRHIALKGIRWFEKRRQQIQISSQ